MKLLLVSIIPLLLGACTGSEDLTVNSHVKLPVYESSFGYRITALAGYAYAEKAPSGEYFYFGYPSNGANGMRAIELHELHSPCSPSLTGASQTEPLIISNGKAGWGRADIWELSKQEGYMFDTSNMKCGAAPHAYAFCSENDGKTVVICISQMTDNREQAKEIFETFRWTK